MSVLVADLIAALERATGPDLYLDAGIALAVGIFVVSERGRSIWDTRGETPRFVIALREPLDAPKELSGLLSVPRYTASIDADLNITRTSRGGQAFGLWQARICLDTVEDDPDETGPQEIGEGSTPPLALCVAALRARSATWTFTKSDVQPKKLASKRARQKARRDTKREGSDISTKRAR